ncbi:MAG: sulfurtransferase [Polyangiaceae bacterium]|nr:sulfurtransferase [Polyangiaceae bacterium]
MSSLVNAKTLQTWIKKDGTGNKDSVVLIDVRWYLTKSPLGRTGREEYEAGHLPGALFWDLDRDLSAKEGPGRHPLPHRDDVIALLERSGISKDTRVVGYDDAGGSIAARLWYVLRRLGHEKVYVLDGGLDAWKREGGALTSDLPAKPLPTKYVAKEPGVSEPIDKQEVVRAAQRGALLLDARSPDRYRGETEPVDARPGRIPGAVNVPWVTNLSSSKEFLDKVYLLAKYMDILMAPEESSRANLATTEIGTRETIVYCGSGVTACHVILAMHEAGFKYARLYEGSYSDWARDPELRVDRG